MRPRPSACRTYASPSFPSRERASVASVHRRLEHRRHLLETARRNRSEQRFARTKVVVRRGVGHADAPRHLAHGDGRMPLRLDELRRLVDQGAAQIAVMVGLDRSSRLRIA